MQDQIFVSVGADHTYECNTNIIGRMGEADASCLVITIPEYLCHCWVYLDFEKPSGEKIRTSKLTAVNGVAQYNVPRYILAESGEIKVQLVLDNGEGVVWKSSIKKYYNEYSINADDVVNGIPENEKQDFLTEAQTVLDKLSKEVEEIAEILSNDKEFVDIVVEDIFEDTRIVRLLADTETLKADVSGLKTSVNNLNTNKVPKERKVNNKALTEDITVSPEDIPAGTFNGQVVANSSGQSPFVSLVRNSKLVSTETNPTVNGEIYWQYS